jgi:hypothetical protein
VDVRVALQVLGEAVDDVVDSPVPLELRLDIVSIEGVARS